MKADQHIEEEFGTRLYNDVENWQGIVNKQIK
jgi:hypothetical protein